MRVVVIGGSGHIGTYLTPRLVEAGHHVVHVSRSQKQPYRQHEAWGYVECVTLDRAAEEAAGQFGRHIRELKPDAVVDIICYTPESAAHLVEGLRGEVGHFLHCGTIWVHGPRLGDETTEEEPRRPFGDYGCRKAAIEELLLAEARRGDFPATILHPGHLVGPGWTPITPQGNFNAQVFSDLAGGRTVRLPNEGRETLHHVHADDVAQAFVCAIDNRHRAVGESFHVVSPGAVSLREYAETVAGWFGQAADLEYQPFEEWRTGVSERDARITLDHLAHSPNCSIHKAEQRLGYRPRYTSMAAVREALDALIQTGAVTV